MFRVLVADPCSEKGVGLLREAGDVQVDVKTGLSQEELVGIIAQYDGLIVRSQTKVTQPIIEAGCNLRIIGRAGVGVDNIDVAAATEKGIVVVNAPEGNNIAAAEHTIAMMMALARQIPQANQLLKSGKWEKKKFMGVELRGKVLGVVGLGKIGSEVARRARGLEMQVMAYDPYVGEERAKQMGVQLASFPEVLGEADFLTMHLPLSEETYHLISTKEFAMMKNGVRILNVARGGIVDEEALYQAINSGKVVGAAIDVFETEPMTQSPLFELPQVIVTPHLGASTEEAQVNVAIEVAQEVLRQFRGQLVRNAVNIPSIKPELYSVIYPYLGLVEKMGNLASQLVDGRINILEIRYSGELSQHDLTSLTYSFLTGLLKPVVGDTINYVNAQVVARSRGIKVYEKRSLEIEDYANLISVTVNSNKGQVSLAGTLFGDNEPRIIKVDDYSVDAVPEGYLLVIPHIDRPRIVGPVATTIGEFNVNIAGMQLGRKVAGGKAIMLLAVDSPVPEEALRRINEIEGILDVKYVCL